MYRSIKETLTEEIILMRYEGAVYRPPSEAYSLIIQATIGCSHNKSTFCNMYKDKKFRIRETNEIIEGLKSSRRYYSRINLNDCFRRL